MFNFFDELKSRFGINNDTLAKYQIINIAGNFLYVEGQNGLITLSQELISFRVKGGVAIISGENLRLEEITASTLIIKGKIKHTEVV